MIKKITFEIETITPMFLAGAEQGKAELRAASIKGLLRFWWRALQAESGLDELRKKESRIFGSSDEGVGGAKFTIRATQPDKQPLPEYKNPGRNDPVGYHLYSVFMQRDKKRPYFPEGSKFKIILTSRDENVLKIASASLWALLYLGGIGTRARRGAGNMVVINLEGEKELFSDTELDFISKGSNAEEIAEWLKNNFESAKKIVNNGKTMFISEYSNLSFSRFVIANEPFKTWKEALGATGFKVFRDSNKSRIFDTASFGFPIMHRTSHTTVTGKTGNEPFSRRSSPIIFKLIKFTNHYYWIVIRISGELLPEGGVIKADRNTKKPEYGIIDEFWAELKTIGKEHILSMPDTLTHIIEGIKKECKPQKIIFFGSKARGDFHSRSDTDIAVETEKTLERANLNGAVDLVNLKTADASLKKKIEKEGVVVYERKG